MNSEFSLYNDIIDYYCDFDDENSHTNIYVDDVEDLLVNNLTDDELCEFFGIDAEFLVSVTRNT